MSNWLAGWFVGWLADRQAERLTDNGDTMRDDGEYAGLNDRQELVNDMVI